MKILYLITQADNGGAQNYVLTLAKHFKGEIAAGNEAEKLLKDARAAGLAVFSLKHLKRDISLWNDFWAIWEIRKLIKSTLPDIAHLNSTKAGFLGSLAAIGLKTKIVFTAHGFRYLEPLSLLAKGFYFCLEKLASLFRDYIISVSNTDRISALKWHLISPKKISVIYNGLPILNFLYKDEARSQLNLPQNKIILGNTSNFYKTKGQDILVEAVSKLPKDILNKILFVIFGSGPEEKKIKSKIKNLKLENSFRLFGQILNAKIYLKALDGFILPSRKEGFAYGLLEAMQAGLPIVATDVGGNKEALDNAGILIQPENPTTLAEKITELVNSDALKKHLSAKVEERSKLFTEENMLKETKKIYEKIFNQGTS